VNQVVEVRKKKEISNRKVDGGRPERGEDGFEI
jgi:hypothetical protein